MHRNQRGNRHSGFYRKVIHDSSFYRNGAKGFEKTTLLVQRLKNGIKERSKSTKNEVQKFYEADHFQKLSNFKEKWFNPHHNKQILTKLTIRLGCGSQLTTDVLDGSIPPSVCLSPRTYEKLFQSVPPRADVNVLQSSKLTQFQLKSFDIEECDASTTWILIEDDTKGTAIWTQIFTNGSVESHLIIEKVSTKDIFQIEDENNFHLLSMLNCDGVIVESQKTGACLFVPERVSDVNCEMYVLYKFNEYSTWEIVGQML